MQYLAAKYMHLLWSWYIRISTEFQSHDKLRLPFMVTCKIKYNGICLKSKQYRCSHTHVPWYIATSCMITCSPWRKNSSIADLVHDYWQHLIFFWSKIRHYALCNEMYCTLNSLTYCLFVSIGMSVASIK